MKLYNNKVLTTYFILQPIIDIITGLMKFYTNVSLSLAMIIRFLFIIYCTFYLLKSKEKKVYLFFLIWFLYGSISTIGNFYLKDNFSILHHLYNLFRMIYFQIVLLFFYLYFKHHKILDNKTFIKMGFIVGLSLLISMVTKTSFCSYDEFENCLPKGLIGYFYSANEYGSILIALFGYQIIEFMKKKKLINFICLLLLTIFFAVIGTKTSIIGFIGLISVYTIYFLINSLFFNKERRKEFKYVLVLLVLLGGVLINIKRLPIYYNLYTQYLQVVEVQKNENPEITEEDLKEEVHSSLVFNGRADFVRVNSAIYKNAPLFNKLFGITDQDNYYEGELVMHINERDIHDLIMIYGIVGLIVEMLLPLSLIYKIIKKIFANFKLLLNDEVIVLGLTLALLFLVSYMAGHSLFHPAVSLYIAYILINILKKVGTTA